MLRFILGTAGTGKTTELLSQIVNCVQRGEKAILLVPEQFSFETERELFRALGPRKSLSVEVLSFTRLCNNIFREYGGLAGTVVTPVGKYLLLSVAMSELTDQLTAYNKSANNIDFLDTLLSAVSECKTSGITPEQLSSYSGLFNENRLSDKLRDLSLIYSTYQALLEQGYLDPDDDLLRACMLLENNNYFAETHVFVDGFTTFMAGEFELLGHCIDQSPSTTFAMTADHMVDIQQGVGVFSTVQGAVAKLVYLAEQSRTTVEKPTILVEPVRYQTEALAHLSKEFLRPVPRPFHGKPEGITIFSGNDMYDEVQKIGAEIQKLVHEKGYRYGDIAVVAREHTEFLRVIELVFSRYEIPFFDDRPKDIENTPLVFGILAGIEAIQSNFAGEAILSLAKSPLLGLPPEEVALLENYHYVWKIRGAQWENPFMNNPRGFTEEQTKEDAELLAQINALRERLLIPLLSLRESFIAGTGEQFAEGLYEYLLGIEASGNLSAYAEDLDSSEKERFLEQNAGLWDSVMDVLDIFVEVLGKRKLGRNRLSELFRLALTATELGTIPQTLDQVLVGAANRIRPWKKKAVFVLGANEGVFPPVLRSVGIFSDNERERLSEIGLELAPTSFKQTLLERFFAYFALTLPSECLMVSYSSSDLTGRELLPSVIISQLMEIFPQIEEKQYYPEDFVFGEESAFSVLASQYQENTPFTATILSYIEQNAPEKLERIRRTVAKPLHAIHRPELARELFGQSMNLSPSRVERYHSCPFRYFMQDGLRIRQRQRAEFSPLESGSLLHYVLQVMVEKYQGKGLAQRTKKQLKDEVEVLIGAYLESRVEKADGLPARFRYLFGRLCNTLAELLAHLGEEFSQSNYEPAAFELRIGWDEDIKPLEFTSEDGTRVTVSGIVDRVDQMEKDGKIYLRVVDYKSGGKEFALSEIMYGMNLQMLLYLFTLEKYWKEQGKDVLPAGVLYLPILENYINTNREESAEDLSEKREKQWAMSGLLLNDKKSLLGMEQEQEGMFIPVWQNKDGSYAARSSLASLEQMGLLSSKIEDLIVSMAENLAAGKIPAHPMNPKEYPTCDYCEYRKVCGYEEGDPVRDIAKKDRQTILQELEEEYNV